MLIWKNESENTIIFIFYNFIIDFYDFPVFFHFTRNIRRFIYHNISDIEKFLFFEQFGIFITYLKNKIYFMMNMSFNLEKTFKTL